MVNEWININVDILFSNESEDYEKQHALFNFHSINDKRLFETFEKVFNDEEELEDIRLKVLNCFFEISDEKDPKQILEYALNDSSEIIRTTAETKLKELEEKKD